MRSVRSENQGRTRPPAAPFCDSTKARPEAMASSVVESKVPGMARPPAMSVSERARAARHPISSTARAEFSGLCEPGSHRVVVPWRTDSSSAHMAAR